MAEVFTGTEEFSSAFELLKQKELQKPDINEVIFIIGLKKDAPEYSALQTAGVDPVALEEGRITRGELLNAGYVFLNRLGAGEKPILNAVIPDPKRAGQFLDLGIKVLLTQDEFDAVKLYQQERPEEYGTGGIEMGELRRDMLLFLKETTKAAEQRGQREIDAFLAAQKRIAADQNGLEILKKYFSQLYKEKDAGLKLDFIMKECLTGIDIIFVRGIPIDVPIQRGGKLRNTPSPFLDSGYHFDTNDDVTLHTHDKSKTRRLNMPVIHLLSRGLNEMGGSLNNSHDQQYITSGQYAREIYPHKTTSENTVSQSSIPDEALNLIASRLLYQAREYLNTTSNK